MPDTPMTHVNKDAAVLQALLRLAPDQDKTISLIDSLLKSYSSLSGVLSASFYDLTEKDKISEKAALVLKFCDVVAHRLAWEELSSKNICENKEALYRYCMICFSQEKNETFHILLFDQKMNFIADKTIQVGTVNKIDVDPVLVVRETLNSNASCVIFVHNHPSGHIMPSTADLQTSRYFTTVLKNLSLNVYDSLIVGTEGVYSLREQGQL